MKNKRKGNVGFIILFVLVAVVYAVYLEVCKNTLLGWGLAIAVLVAYFVIRQKKLRDKKWYVRILGWCCLFLVLAGIVQISKPPYKQIAAVDTKKPQATDVITVEQGDLTGVYSEDEEVEVFAGIPYAAPPVGELRWKEPQEPDSWDGVRVCDTFAPMSMQQEGDPVYSFGSQIIGYGNVPLSLKDNYKEAMSEDSLYLNVWRPADIDEDEELPVLVYIHGGSLNSGQSYFIDYNGESLAKQGVIVVTITYRLGVFGYLANDELAAESENETTGNYGLLDQIQALKWVNENISAFGGDVLNITIAGESAGSSSVNAICVSPLAKGMFRRAVAESSGITAVEPYHTFRSMEDAKEVSSEILDEFDCDSIDELREIPAEELVYTTHANNEMTVDGYAITEQPNLTYEKGNNNEESVLGGYNAEEATVFRMFADTPLDDYEDSLASVVGTDNVSALEALYPATTDEEANSMFNEILGLAWFGYSHYNWSNLMAAEGRIAYLYYFDKDNGGLGSWHSGELPYMYGNLPENSKNYDESDEELSKAMQSYLINYVKTGNPNGEGLPAWYTYDNKPQEIMSFSEDLGMMKNPHLSFYEIVDKYMDSKR